MTLDTQFHAAVGPAAPSRFVVACPDAPEPPARVIEYVRLAHSARVEPEPLPASSGSPWPVMPHSRLPNRLTRLLVAWGLLTLASLTGPCRPLSPSPALAAEASP